ncbi:nuclear transport factor 2 family protein [Mycobacterium sp.]|uniref:nuclear transport factor 2 family protein n=1 Tax=Mycobacterium sp. TaxID=1785 RepID=UPI002B8BCD9B|nr:nuclear transport factor 2 family protein [Mycobacterium sp.]HME49359.1 nuclear transport factor 2 family protein [Mycobacterium sp.]
MGEVFDPGAVGRAFSEHRFDEVFPHLADDVRWTVVGYMVLEGADAVIRTCRDTLESLKGTTISRDRCITAVGDGVVAVDSFDRYSGPDGVTAVARCNTFEFSGDKIASITSYAVEVDPDCAGAPPPGFGDRSRG